MGLTNDKSGKCLLAWNEALNVNPPWVPTRLTVPSINNASPQTGNSSAAILHEDATGANTHYLTYSVLPKQNIVYCTSIFAKQLNRTWIRVPSYAGTRYFNLATGAMGAATGTVVNSGMIMLPNSWYRCFVASLAVSTALNYDFYIAEADNDVTFDGLNQDSLYVWRPMVNEGYYPEDTSFATREVPIT